MKHAQLVSILLLCTSSPSFALCGDCNMDGQINVIDALRIAQMAAGILTPVAADYAVCDVDNDGDIDVLDSLRVAQAAAGSPVVLTCPPAGMMPPACTITSPNPTSPTQTGAVPIIFNSSDPDSATLTCTFEYSTNGGAAFSLGTTDVSSPAPYTSNPAMAAPPGAGRTWIWDSLADLPGISTGVTFRVSVSDGTTMSQCLTVFTLDNRGGVGAPPSCAITAPSPSSPVQMGNINIAFNSMDTDTMVLNCTFQYSTNAGVTFILATVAAGAPPPYTMNPAAGPRGAGQTFRWGSATDIPGAANVIFRLTVNDGTSTAQCTSSFQVNNGPAMAPPSCGITSPTPASPVQMGDINIVFTSVDTDSPTLTVSFAFSTNAGVSFTAATVAAGSPPPYTMNPTIGAPVGPGQTFRWGSVADLPGTSPVTFRVTVDDGFATTSCTTTFTVNNGGMGMPPSCMILSPLAGAPVQAGDIGILFSTADPDSAMITLTFQYSTNAGVSFALASVAPTSPAPYTVNPTVGVPPGMAQNFKWASAIDIPGTSPVTFRLTVNDGTSMATCTTTFTVDNRAMMTPPSCAITSPTPASPTQSGDIDIIFNSTDPDSASLMVTFQYSPNGGAVFLNAAVALTSPAPYTVNPTPSAPPGMARVFRWASAADIPTSAAVIFRVIVNDGTTVANCQVSFMVDNTPVTAPPSCSITAPTPASPIQMGDVSIAFGTVDADSPILTVTFAYSTNGGALYSNCTVAPSSPAPYTMNPTPSAPTGGGMTFIWASATDIVGAASVAFRITVFDGTATRTCTTAFAVNNGGIMMPPSCMITSPTIASPVQMGNIPILFNSVDPDSLLITVSFHYSTNAGVSFALATVGAGAMPPYTMNPTMSAPPGMAQTFIWGSAPDVPGAASVRFRVTVFDGTTTQTCVTDFMVNNTGMPVAPTCQILTPGPGSMQSGVISVLFTTIDPDSATLSVLFQYSTNAGVSFSNCAVDVSSPAPYTVNPTPAAPPGLGQTFKWASATDIPGSSPVVFRITVNDGVTTPGTCTQSFTVTNGVMPVAPTCQIIMPAAGAMTSGVVSILFLTTDPDSVSLNVLFQYSTNAGVSFTNCTVDLTSPAPYTVNPTPAAPPGIGQTFKWASASDILGSSPVVFRITVNDGVTTPGTCTQSFTVTNGVMPVAPTCQIIMPAAGAMTSGVVSILFLTTDPDSVSLNVLFQYSTNAGVSFTNCTVDLTSPAPYTVNPTPAAPPGIGQTFKWASASDILGSSPVVFRITVNDGVTTPGTCTQSFTVTNGVMPVAPVCQILMPAVGSMQSGVVSILFLTTDPDSVSLNVLFQYSTNAGVSFTNCTVDITSPAPYTVNPTPAAPPGIGQTFKWASASDILGSSPVVFRITVNDGVTTPGTCTQSFTVTNGVMPVAPVCQILMPAVGSMQSGVVSILFLTTDPDSVSLNVLFQYSTNAGVSFTNCTVDLTSPAPYTVNPTPAAPPGIGQTFKWASASDILGSSPVVFRITVNDGVTTPGTCTQSFTVTNGGGVAPICNITPLVGIQTGTVSILFDTVDPDSPTLNVLFEFSTNGGVSFTNCTVAGTSPAPYTVNPTPAAPPGLARTFRWNSTMDVPPPVLTFVTFRITVSDGVTAPGVCTRDFPVQN